MRISRFFSRSTTIQLLAILLVCSCSKNQNEQRGGSASPTSEVAEKRSGDETSGEALRHLPSNCPVVGRIEIGKVLTARQLASHRAEIEAAIADKQPASRSSVLSGLVGQIGIDPSRDLETATFCLRDIPLREDANHDHESASRASNKPSKVPFVIALSGRFGSRQVIDAIAQAAPKGTFAERTIAGTRVLERGGKMFAQATDKVLLIATDGDILGAAMTASDEYKKYALPADGAIALSAAASALRTLTTGKQDPITHPIAVEAAKAKHLDLEIRLDSSTATVHLAMASNEEAVATAGRFERILSPFKSGPQLAQLREHISADLLASLRDAKVLAQDASVTAVFPMTDGALGELLHGFAVVSVLSKSRSAPTTGTP